jgi:hypothetical protein
MHRRARVDASDECPTVTTVAAKDAKRLLTLFISIGILALTSVPLAFAGPVMRRPRRTCLIGYSRIVALAAEIDALYTALPDDQRRGVRPLHPPTYS